MLNIYKRPCAIFRIKGCLIIQEVDCFLFLRLGKKKNKPHTFKIKK